MCKFEETDNMHQNNAESSSRLILTFLVLTKSSFRFVNGMIPLNSTWVPSLGDKLTQPICWTCIQSQSRAVSFQFPPAECSFHPSWAALATATDSPQHHGFAMPFNTGKQRAMDLICSGLLHCGVCKWSRDPFSPYLCYSSTWITYWCVYWKYMPQKSSCLQD